MTFKSLGGIFKKGAQEAAEEAAEGASKVKKGRRVKEAKVSGSSDDVVTQAIKREREAQAATTFNIGDKYYMKTDDGYVSKTGKRGTWEDIEEATFGEMHGKYVEAQKSIGAQEDIDIRQKDLDNAFEVKSKGPGDDSGFNFKDHPYISTAVASSIALGAGFMFGSSDDDEEEI